MRDALTGDDEPRPWWRLDDRAEAVLEDIRGRGYCVTVLHGYRQPNTLTIRAWRERWPFHSYLATVLDDEEMDVRCADLLMSMILAGPPDELFTPG